MYPKYPYYKVTTITKEQIETFPAQHQDRQPGIESLMHPKPIIENLDYRGSGKLQGKVAIITGGDSGIGAAAAISFAKEGADHVIPYYSDYEKQDADRTKGRIQELGQQCLLIPGDLRDPHHCEHVVQQTINEFGKLNILVNNHGVQFPQESLLDISNEGVACHVSNKYLRVFLHDKKCPSSLNSRGCHY